VAARPVTLVTPSERLLPPVRRLLPGATLREASLAAVLASGQWVDADAMVLPLSQAAYAARMQPGLSAVVPEDSSYRLVNAYGLPLGARELRDVVDAWIAVARGAGQFARADDDWVRGRAERLTRRRWSLAHDVLGWW
jgi:hypothetical protein